MADAVKPSSEMRPELLEQLRRHAEASNRTLASVLDEAAEQYLARERVSPAFREATEHVLDEHADLLERLAR